MEIGRIVPTPRGSAWAQIFSARLNPRDEAGLVHLVVVVELSAPAEFELPRLGKAVFRAVRERLLTSPSGFFKSLERGLEGGKAVFKQKLFPLAAPESVSFSVVVLVSQRQYVYLAQFGGATAGFWRRGELHVLLTPDVEDKVVSGVVEPGDVLVLASRAFVEGISRGEVQAALAGGEPSEAVDALAPKVHAGEVDGRAAAAFIRVEDEDIVGPGEVDAALDAGGDSGLTWSPRRLFLAVRRVFKTGLSFFRTYPGIYRLGREVYVRDSRQEGGRRRKRLRLALLVLVGLLLISVWRGWQGRSSARKQAEVDQLVLQAEKRYQEAVSVADLNPARSRALLVEAQGYLEDADRLLAGAVSRFPFRRSRLERGSSDELAGKLARLLADVSRSFPVSPKRIFDLESIAPGAAGAALSPFGDRLLILDSGRGAVYQVDAAKKKGRELAAGEELKGSLDLAGNFVLGKDGIFRIGERSLIRVIEEAGSWRRPSRLARFGANLYVLDPGAGQIHKYVGLAGGFSLPQEYLQADGADLSQATEMAIDGRVWVFRENGEIVPFMGGKAEVFVATGLEEPFSGDVRLYTNEDLPRLYLLDRGNDRIVVLSKAGEYQEEYRSGDFAGAADLAVDPKEEKVWLVRGSLVEEVALKK
jgi:hypothetical protein